MPKKGGLGRGLGALIPQGIAQVSSEAQAVAPLPDAGSQSPNGDTALSSELSTSYTEVAVDRIAPNPRQPRQEMHPEGLDDLATSIREHGLLQPLVVTHAEGDNYTLIAGERRWRAAILAGLQTVPVVVKEASSREMLELALVENLQRADLNPLEEAAAYHSLVEEFGLTQVEVAGRVGKSRQAVANALRLLKLPRAVQESLSLGLISEGHARAILQVPSEEQQIRLMEHAVAEGLNVRQVEALARRLAEDAQLPKKAEEKAQTEPVPLYNEINDLEDRFRDALGTKVQLSRSRRGGKLVIYFYSDEELDRIYGAIVGDEE